MKQKLMLRLSTISTYHINIIIYCNEIIYDVYKEYLK